MAQPAVPGQGVGPNAVGSAIEEYSALLQSLAAGPGGDFTSRLLSAFRARDRLAKALAEDSTKAEEAALLIRLDVKLKSAAAKIVSLAGEQSFAELRETFQPTAGRWWWWLDERVAQEKARRTVSLQLVAAICVIISIKFISEIGLRLTTGEGDSLAGINSVVQVVLPAIGGLMAVLLVGANLPEPVSQWALTLLAPVSRRRYGTVKQLILAILLLGVSALGRFWGVCVAAQKYYDQGFRNWQAENLTRAREKYQRAIALCPDFAQAHYSLAIVFEDTQKDEEAIKEYETAVRLDSSFGAASNNLARLYLRRNKDADARNALAILDPKIQVLPPDPHDQYSLYKNHGWANYLLKNYAQAENDLRRAIQIEERGASAHYLLAKVLETQKKEGAKSEYRACVVYSNQSEDVDRAWVADAANHLQEQ